MDKILFISDFPPELYNRNGPTRLVYDILRACNYKEKVDLVVFKGELRPNYLPQDVGFRKWSEIKLKQKNRDDNNHIFKIGMVPKAYLKYRNCIINTEGYYAVITYPFQLSLINYTNTSIKIFSIGMDSSTLLYLRGLLYNRIYFIKIACIIRLLQNLRLELLSSKKVNKIFTVGEYDAFIYKAVFKKKCIYIPHPVTDMLAELHAPNWNGQENLRICFAGALSRFYTSSMLKEIVYELLQKKNQLSKKITLFFLGEKLEKSINLLRNNGYKVYYTVFAESFEEYLSQCHLFIAPLVVGAGTKNRILTAVALGLDVIGTDVALENVYGMKCYNLANNGKEVVEQIETRLRRRKLYSLDEDEIKKFFEYHSIIQWTNSFWNKIID